MSISWIIDVHILSRRSARAWNTAPQANIDIEGNSFDKLDQCVSIILIGHVLIDGASNRETAFAMLGVLGHLAIIIRTKFNQDSRDPVPGGRSLE